MTTLVTGGNGFLGKHLVRALRKNGHTVSVPHRSVCDLRDAADVDAAYSAFDPDIVVHLAATVGGIGFNQAHPGECFYDNMAMGLNVIHAAKEHGVKKVVVVGTCCSYPKHCEVPFGESDLWNGYPEETNAPYGVAKRSLATMLDAYHRQYGLDYAYPILANLYGPGDNFDLETSHVIPAMIRKFCDAVEMGEDMVTLWGSGAPTRDFLYVEDAAEAIADVADRDLHAGPVVNVSGGKEVRICDLAYFIADQCGYKGSIAWEAAKPDGQPRRLLAYGKVGSRRTPLADGIRKTVEWYRANVQQTQASVC